MKLRLQKCKASNPQSAKQDCITIRVGQSHVWGTYMVTLAGNSQCTWPYMEGKYGSG